MMNLLKRELTIGLQYFIFLLLSVQATFIIWVAETNGASEYPVHINEAEAWKNVAPLAHQLYFTFAVFSILRVLVVIAVHYFRREPKQSIG